MKRILLAEKATQNPTKLQIQDYAAEMSKKHNVPLELILRHLWIESSYNINARSKKDAFGLMQLIPAAARTVGVDREDWRQNIEGGTKYLSRMHKKYTGKTAFPWVVASMAYYTGPGNIDKTVKSAKENNMEILDYVVMMKNKKSQYHMSIFGYAKSIYDDGHRRNANRPKIETTKASKGFNFNIHPAVKGGSEGSVAKLQGRAPAALRGRFGAGSKPDSPKTKPKDKDSSALILPSKEVEKISHISTLKTPTIKISKDESGKQYISYEGDDPLKGNIKFSPRLLDKEVKDLFGYANWDEYVKENQKDLQVDKFNLHPFHVAYAMQEFVDGFDEKDYVLVGVPNNNDTANSLKIKMLSGLRKGLFGDSRGTVSLSRLGTLNSALYAPAGGLANASIITTIKKNTKIADISANLRATPMSVQHPDGDFWNASFSPQTTKNADSALKVAAMEKKSSADLLNESIMTKGQFERQLLNEAALLLPSLLQARNATLVYSFFSRVLPAVGRAIKGPAVKTADTISNFLSKRKNVKAAKKAAKEAAKEAAKDAGEGAAKQGLMSRLTSVLAHGWVGKQVFGSDEEKEKDTNTGFFELIAYGVVGKYITGNLGSIFKFFAYSTIGLGVGGVMTGLAAFISKGEEILENEGEEKYEEHWQKLYDLLDEAWPNFAAAINSATDLDLPTNSREFFTGAQPTDEQTNQIIGSVANKRNVTAKTKKVSSADDIKFYLLPKDWKKGKYYTENEARLAQRVGANLKSGLIVTGKGETLKKDYLKWKSEIINFIGVSSQIPSAGQTMTPKINTVSVKNLDALIFGHSQASPTALGGTIESMLTSSGMQVKRLKFDGDNDKRLVSKLTQIPNKSYRVAYLFLNGNVYSPTGPLYEDSKLQIINYVNNNLKVPKQNIIVILPPINKDNELSSRRYQLNVKAKKFFEANGVRVAKIVVANQASFSKNGLYLKSGAPEAKSLASSVSVKLAAAARPSVSTGPGPLIPESETGDISQEDINRGKKIGLELFSGAGRVRPVSNQKSFAQKSAINFLNALGATGDKWTVGDITNASAKLIAGVHRSHQTGLDVDLAIPYKDGTSSIFDKVNNSEKFDKKGRKIKRVLKRGWDYEFYDDKKQIDMDSVINMLKVAQASGAILIIVDQKIINMIKTYAMQRNMITEAIDRQLMAALDLLSPGKGDTHLDHFHIRLPLDVDLCPGQKGGRSCNSEYLKNWMTFDQLSKFIKKTNFNIQKTSVAPSIALTKRAAGAAQPKSARAAAVERKKREPEYGYVFGGIRPGSTIYSMYNQDKFFGNGASMNKPILALVQLIMYRNQPEKLLTDDELRGLLTYSGKFPGEGSNQVNRLITGREVTAYRGLKKRVGIAGTVSADQASKYLELLGLDPKMRIRFGNTSNNSQTPEQYFDFMRLIHDKEKILRLGIQDEINKILPYMKRSKALGLAVAADRESERWPVLLKTIRKKGIQVSEIYGKGGLVNSTFHYAFVIDNKYLLVMYSKRPVYGKQTKKHIDWFFNKFADILSTVMTRKQVNENLLAYKPFLAGGLK